MRRALIAVSLVVSSLGGTPARPAASVPHLSKVFVIMEENTDYSRVFGTSKDQAPYLNALADAHVRHDAYYGIAHLSMGNYTGLVSGQIPPPLDHADCPTPFATCLRPGPTIGRQLDDAGRTWRAYMESMGEPCTHPDLTGTGDNGGDHYATHHNPFVFFTEIALDQPYCEAHDVDYDTAFAADLASGPMDFNLIVPNDCHNGHDPCFGKRQIENLDDWLAINVPPILDYLATDPNAVLIITFDESGPTDTTGCCDQLPVAQGGGHIGLVMVAPGLERAGYKATSPANHYSLLRTIEDGLGLAPLGEAGSPLVSPMSEMFVPA